MLVCCPKHLPLPIKDSLSVGQLSILRQRFPSSWVSGKQVESPGRFKSLCDVKCNRPTLDINVEIAQGVLMALRGGVAFFPVLSPLPGYVFLRRELEEIKEGDPGYHSTDNETKAQRC